ncbi:single-stranded DNA-binding protein [Actinomycetaceae bacterium L2_0104]
MSNETYVAVRGFVGAVPAIYGNDTNRNTVVIRIGVTARSYNREAGEYRDGTTAWYSVRCYGALGANVAGSVRKGTPVLVRGRLVPRTWTDRHDQTHTEFNILADSVGIELGTGIANFARVRNGELPSLEGEPASGSGTDRARGGSDASSPGPAGSLAVGNEAYMPGVSVASGSFDADGQGTALDEGSALSEPSEASPGEYGEVDEDAGIGAGSLGEEDAWAGGEEVEDPAGNLSGAFG